MSRKCHHLEIETEYYQAFEKGIKTFLFRLNDCDFKVGDAVYLKEIVRGVVTGRGLPFREITYILHGDKLVFGKDYCILQLK